MELKEFKYLDELFSAVVAPIQTKTADLLKKYGFRSVSKIADMIINHESVASIVDAMQEQRKDLDDQACIKILREIYGVKSSRQIESAKIEVDTNDLSEVCISDFFEPQGLDSVISILPVEDVTDDTCVLIQDQLNRDGDFSDISAPEEVLSQAQVIFDNVDYDAAVVSLSSENYLVFKMDNALVKVKEEPEVKLVQPEDTVVIETADGDFLVKSKDANFVEFLDEELGDGTGDDEEMTEIVDGLNSSVKLDLADPEFVKSSGYHYCLVNSSKTSLLKNLLESI